MVRAGGASFPQTLLTAEDAKQAWATWRRAGLAGTNGCVDAKVWAFFLGVSSRWRAQVANIHGSELLGRKGFHGVVMIALARVHRCGGQALRGRLELALRLETSASSSARAQKCIDGLVRVDGDRRSCSRWENMKETKINYFAFYRVAVDSGAVILCAVLILATHFTAFSPVGPPCVWR